MKKITPIIILMLVGFILGNAQAVDIEESGQELKLYLGKIKMLSINAPTRIAIGNPDIVDVARVSKTTLTLNPMTVGTTSLVVWDALGEQAYKVRVFSENMEEVKQRINNLLKSVNVPGVYAQAEDTEGKIFLLGSIKTAQDRDRINLVLAPLKDKVVDLIMIKEEETVIEIEVQILELDKDATTTLGFSWPGSINVAEVGTKGLAPAGAKIGDLFSLDKFQRATYSAGTYTADPFTVKLDALVQEGKARILSRPRLACQSGKEAELLVGGEKPIFTTTVNDTSSSTTSTVDYKEYGIKLKIKPTVNEDDRIKVALNVDVSEVQTADTLGTTSTASTTTTAKAYPLTKRSASTELFLNDGQAMAIGGLIKQKTEEDIRKTPGLGDIPIFGWLFKKKVTKIGGGQGERSNTELFITLTPRIVSRDKIGATVKEAEMLKASTFPTKKSPLPDKKTKSADAPVLAEQLPAVAPEKLVEYAQIIQKRILENVAYPAEAKEAGLTGTVKVSLHLASSGELLEAFIKEPSGQKILDDSAIMEVKRYAPYPAFPAAITQKEIWIDVPIKYELN